MRKQIITKAVMITAAAEAEAEAEAAHALMGA